MIKLNEDRSRLIPFFNNMHQTPLVLSYLQGHMGEGWIDRVEEPTCAQIRLGEFSIVAGAADSKEATDLVLNLPLHVNSPWFLIIPQDESWGKLISQCYPERSFKITRYAIKNDTVFPLDKLQASIAKLPAQYRITRIDEKLYNMCLQHPQLKDLCSHFSSAEDYVRRGIGYCILHDEKLICGASSYAVFDNGIELEIDTAEEYRRQGLATICASQLITECVKNGIYPRWDAASPKSLDLAKKLGYEFSHEYPAYAIKMDTN